ncbi:peptidoglycan D,D-transpeptidase FtsI family protein [Malaciobacter mytili]|uniref:Cell division protein FtsW n=1 Tax=Malaciobacter mytili LMG 24559 TaxID=1032238 RepID=A0AAX2AJC0_9BACT|nr:penicillin-binding protein 2 [Malaciobacter mytili]AXH15856.1 cell division protein FtsI / penicillin-binding protein [Malaciobacter mytili LMG 24559]RXK16422.1 cell division protein FtsW [Malaciobacter mytili LMG 24559]
MTSNNIENINKTKKIVILFLLILLFLIILIFSIANTMTNDRRLPSLQSTKKELAVRGDIVSSDNFKIASSKKLYKASIDTRYLDLNKKELFIKLFSIYSDISYGKLKTKIDESLKDPGNLVLSYNIDSRTAKNLKELGFKLRRLGVFKQLKIDGGRILRGLNISESGEKRIYSYETTLTPVVGYITKYESNIGKTKVRGIKGLEKKYDDILNKTEDGVLQGNRDVLSYISFDKNSIIKKREDGAKLVLNVPLKLQKNIEMILDKHKEKLTADEIIVSIMNSKTGEVISLASSNRFNPESIKQEDIPSLNVNAVEYQFEPGSVIKPIALALVLDKNRAKTNELFYAYNKGTPNSRGEYPRGRYKIDRFYIKDDHRFKKNYLTLDDIMIFSSNIGLLQLAQRLKGAEIFEGYKRFGFTRKTGIDLPYEKVGQIPPVFRLAAGENKNQDNVFKATVSYGQGMTSTFMQVLKAYSVFNNDGFSVTPRIVSYVEMDSGKYKLDTPPKEKVISKESADEIKRMLIKTVTDGTGKSAQMEGLEIGGKTGTAQIARRGSYLKKYISSFFGFVNDDNNSYTIGVTVINPNSTGKYWYYYYAAQSAVPVFKEVVKNLVSLNYITPKNDIISNKN